MSFDTGDIGDAASLYWLKAHIAGMADGNTFSTNSKPSRLSIPERVARVNANLSPLYYFRFDAYRTGVAIGRLFVQPGDAYQLMCVDLVGYDRERGQGGKFITHLPLKYDACCSGLGHTATMVRSLEARFAKITPGDHPDLYTVVAEDCFNNSDLYTVVVGGLFPQQQPRNRPLDYARPR